MLGRWHCSAPAQPVSQRAAAARSTPAGALAAREMGLGGASWSGFSVARPALPAESAPGETMMKRALPPFADSLYACSRQSAWRGRVGGQLCRCNATWPTLRVLSAPSSACVSGTFWHRTPIAETHACSGYLQPKLRDDPVWQLLDSVAPRSNVRIHRGPRPEALAVISHQALGQSVLVDAALVGGGLPAHIRLPAARGGRAVKSGLQ
jgi:hypothetical protein